MVWISATLEHQLRYKKGIEEMTGYDGISEELLHSAKAIIEADNEMQRIKEMCIRDSL